MSDRVKYTCSCGWWGFDVLRAASPFDADDVLVGCPSCRQIDTINRACDVDGCPCVVVAGIPMPNGDYRTVCSTHSRVVLAERDAERATGSLERRQ